MEPSAIDIANAASKITYYCCVLGCNNNSENNPNSTFHSLPVMNQMNSSKNTGDEKIQFLSKQLKICDQHFKQNNVLKVLNNDPSSTYTMSLVMPSVNTKQQLNQQSYHDEGFILGPADIPLAGGSTEEIIEEEVITTEEIPQGGENYSIMMDEEEYISVKSEECYDLDNVCRICLSEENLRNIETDYIDDVLLYDMLRTCVNSNSPVEEKLPKRICISCVTDLKTMYDFVLRYKSTKSTLENFINKQQDINERRFYLEHGYINQSVNISDDGSDMIPSTSLQRNTDPEEIKISNSINSLTKELINNVKGKSNIELDGKTYVLAKAFLCKTCNELLFVKESLDEHKCDTKKKSQGAKQTKTNLIIKQTDINRCNHCGRKFSNLANHICDVSHKMMNDDYDSAPAQKCPKCKIIFKYYHKCDQDPQSFNNKKMPLLLVKQNKKRKVVSTM